MEAVSNAFNTFCTISFTDSILEDRDGATMTGPREQSSLIQFRNGGKDAGLLERCGRSFLVEPILVVVALCALVETTVRIALTIFAWIASNLVSSDISDISEKLVDSTGCSYSALGISISWITKNLLIEKLDYTKDLDEALEPLNTMVGLPFLPLFFVNEIIKSTGLNKVLNTVTNGVLYSA
jgi:hypothetical protein